MLLVVILSPLFRLAALVNSGLLPCTAPLLAKYALTRQLGEHNADPRYAALEDELLELVNKTGVGPSGLGGRTTALGVNVEFTHTHIGGLPCAVNLNCHQARRAEAEI